MRNETSTQAKCSERRQLSRSGGYPKHTRLELQCGEEFGIWSELVVVLVPGIEDNGRWPTPGDFKGERQLVRRSR